MWFHLGFGFRKKTIRGGRFNCPTCLRPETYSELVEDTVLHIGVIPIRTNRDPIGIICHGCKSQFDYALLDYTPDDIRRVTSPWTCECGRENEFLSAGCDRCGARRPDLAAIPHVSPDKKAPRYRLTEPSNQR